MPLAAIWPADVAAEGFPGWSTDEFIAFFCTHMRCTPDTEVTRIEWRYLTEIPAAQTGRESAEG